MKGLRLWLLCLALVCRSSWALAVERVAIVVGSNQAPQGRVELRYAHEDARAVAEVLTQVGEFAARDVETLLEPTPERVLAAIDAQIARLAAGGESMVLFYYSGHSDSDALYPAGQRLPLDELRKRLDDPRVTVRLGVVDSCRGGGWTGTKGLREAALFDVSGASALRNVGSVLIASSSGLEDAHESEALRGSYFTHHFNAGLRGAADKNQDARVSVVEAFEYAKALTIRDTALVASAPQHPSFRMNLNGRQDLLLANLGRGESWVALEQREGPLQVVHLQSGLVLVELQPGERAVRVAVPPGRYLVRRRVGTQTYAKEYEVRVGQVTAVAEAELELSGNANLLAKGADTEEWRMRYYLLGLGGLHHGLSFAFAESQYGRLAPATTPATGMLALGVINDGLGLELSLPGRFAWRLNKGGFLEWVPWLGLPYYWAPDAAGKLRFRFGVGVGLDLWARLSQTSRLGFNLGILSQEDGKDGDDFLRAWASVGHAWRASDEWSFHLGVGYAQNLVNQGASLGDLTTAERGAQLSLGSILTDGILPLPLVGYQLSDSLSLGLSAHLDYRLPDHSLGYELTFGWTWRFGQLEMLVK